MCVNRHSWHIHLVFSAIGTAEPFGCMILRARSTRTMPSRYRFLLPCVLALLAVKAGAQCPSVPTDTLFHNDFEGSDGGFTESGGGDWEYGVIPETLDSSNCGSTFSSPGGAFSGTHGWGTVLNSCYDNLGDTSGVGFTADLSAPGLTSAWLDFAQWFDVYVNFDYLTITANGAEIWRNDTAEESGTWLTTAVDLTPWLGQDPVSIMFNLHASTVVNRAGWYIDDVSVLACPDTAMGVHESAAPAFRAWPQPATDLLHVQLAPAMGPVTGWALYDALGRTVAQGVPDGPGTFTLRLPDLHGLAILELRSGMEVLRQRVVVR